MDAWALAGALLLGLIAVSIYALVRREPTPAGLKSFWDLPGPKEPGLRGLLYGNAVQQAATTNSWYPRVHVNWLKWSRKYGQEDGMFRMSNPAMNRKIVMVTDPTLAGVAFARMPKDPCYKNFQCILSKDKGGFDVFSHALEDNTWRAARKYIAPFFTAANIRSKVPVVNEKAKVVVDYLRTTGPDKPVEVQHAMKRLTMDLILETGGYGIKVNALSFGHCQVLEDLSFVILEAALCSFKPSRRPYYQWFSWTKEARNFLDTHDRIYKVWNDIWDGIDAQAEPADSDASLAAGLKRLKASKEGAGFSRRDLMHTAIGLLVAGLDSQALTTSFTLMCLAAHPEKQAKLAHELQQHGLLATPDNPHPRQVTADDLPKLHYTDAVVRESTRLVPVTGLGTLRKTDKSMELGGYWVPKNTTVQVPAYVLHMDTNSFAETDSYIPERWLPDISMDALSKLSGSGEQPDEETIKAVKMEASLRKAAEVDAKAAATRLKYRLMPFSHGTRACPGYGFAMMQLTTILANIIGNFEVTLDPTMGGWAGCKARELNAFTLILVGGNLLRFRPRA